MSPNHALLRLHLILAASIVACQTSDIDTDHLSSGNQYAKDGLLREAAREYEMGATTGHNKMVARRNLGIVLFKLKDYSNALKHLKRSLVKFDKHFETNFYIAESYRALDRYANAIFYYKNSLRLNPRSIKAKKALAWSYYKTRYYAQSLRLAKDLISVAPKDLHARIILARTFLKLRKPRSALNALSNLKDGQKYAPYLKSVQGDAWLQLEKYDSAMKSYKAALRDQPLLAGALIGLGKCLAHTGNNLDAIKFIERSVRIRPRLSEGYLLLGKLYEKTNPRRALKYLQVFSKKAAQDPDYLDRISKVRKKISRLKGNLKGAEGQSKTM